MNNMIKKGGALCDPIELLLEGVTASPLVERRLNHGLFREYEICVF